MHEVAVYAAAYSLAGIGGFFYSVLGFTLFPAMSACWAEGRRDAAARLLGKSLQVYFFFLLPFVIALSICGPDMLLLLATKQYEVSGLVFLLLAGAVGLFGLYQVTFFAVILDGGSVGSMWLMGLVAMVNLGLNAIFVPHWGVTGAAMATFLANGLLALRTATIAGRILPLKDSCHELFPILVRAGLMGACLLGVKIWLPLDEPAGLISMLSLAAIIYLVMDFWGRRSILRALFFSR